MNKLETFIENLMYATRWLLAPICIGLSVALLILSVKFFQELFHMLPAIFTLAESTVILKLLALIDMALVGGLLVMVMFATYENFVSQLNIPEHKEKLDWLGKMDSGSLKTKVSVSIVAISAIHLLKMFVDAEQIDNTKLCLFAMLHLTFVVSALATTFMDRVEKRTKLISSGNDTEK